MFVYFGFKNLEVSYYKWTFIEGWIKFKKAKVFLFFWLKLFYFYSSSAMQSSGIQKIKNEIISHNHNSIIKFLDERKNYIFQSSVGSNFSFVFKSLTLLLIGILRTSTGSQTSSCESSALSERLAHRLGMAISSSRVEV